jgi:nucleotide-binding universal stress UspA family protein
MFRKVFIGVDGTSHGRDAIALATVLAEPGASLTLVHVQPGATPAGTADLDLDARDPTYYAAGRDESHRLLEVEREATGVDAELVTVAGPAVGPALHALAEREGADLLVVGACKHRLAGRILIGDDTRASVHGATCPVGIAPNGYSAEAAPPATIGVGFEFPGGHEALEEARSLAGRHGSKVVALDVAAAEAIGGHVSPPGGASIKTGDGDGGADCAGAASGLPRKTLAEFADQVDLLVIGSRNEGLVRRAILGSTSGRMARHLHHPMLVMPHQAVRHAAPSGIAAGGDDAGFDAGP